MPERLIGAEPEFFLRHMLGSWARDPAVFEPEIFAEYVRCFKEPGDDPRELRGVPRRCRDRPRTRPRRPRPQLTMPLLVPWGQRSSQGSGYDVLSVWREHAETVSGQAIDSSHFLPEEAPEEPYRALRGFFAGGTG